MHQNTAPSERRRHRSKITAEALHLQLKACVERFGLRHMILVDHSGHLMTLPEKQTEAERNLGAYVPLLYEANSRAERKAISRLLRQDLPWLTHSRLTARRICIEGESAYVCCVAPKGVQADLAIAQAIAGMRRICSGLEFSLV